MLSQRGFQLADLAVELGDDAYRGGFCRFLIGMADAFFSFTWRILNLSVVHGHAAVAYQVCGLLGMSHGVISGGEISITDEPAALIGWSRRAADGSPAS
jgi:hypothetical protein